jgi:hypothetical protein
MLGSIWREIVKWAGSSDCGFNPIFLVERFQTTDQNSAIQELGDTGIKVEDFVLEAKLIMKILQKNIQSIQ